MECVKEYELKKKSPANRETSNPGKDGSKYDEKKNFAVNVETKIKGTGCDVAESEIDEVAAGFRAALDRLAASRDRGGRNFGGGFASGGSVGNSGDASSHKIPPKLYRVGEMVAYSGVSRQTIHNYTIMGLIRESDWTCGGHRLYDATAFERLDRIAELRGQRRSMDYIRDYLSRRDAAEGV